MNTGMNTGSRETTRRVTANLPVRLLEEACRATGDGITETLVRGLDLVRRSAAASRARSLRGKLHLDLDLAALRGRARH